MTTLLEAAKELSALKELKDKLESTVLPVNEYGTAMQDYQRRKPLAWDDLRAAIAAEESRKDEPTYREGYRDGCNETAQRYAILEKQFQSLCEALTTAKGLETPPIILAQPPAQRDDSDSAPSFRAAVFNWLCKKYAQSQDERQKAMCLQYMTAETHDLAENIAEQLAAELPLPAQQEEARPQEPVPLNEYTTDPLALAVLFHATYERLAAEFSYTTRTETRIFDPESPNGKLMIAVCRAVLAAQAEKAK